MFSVRNLALAAAGGWLAVRAYRSLTALDLTGKTVLVTGGSRGLGLEIARELLGHRAKLVLCARDGDELERAHDELTLKGGHLLSIPCDVTDRAAVFELIEVVRERFGPIDVLINNAGVIEVGPVETMTLADFEEAMRVNFWATVHTVQAVLPDMRQRRFGRIVNVTSIGGKVATPHLLPYVASKFAAVGFSEGLRAELAKDGVLVTTVVPGLMRTGSPVHAKFKGDREAEYAWFTTADALPLSSISSTRAARAIVAAMRRGDAELTLSLPAQLAARFHGLFPGLTADLLGLVNRFLPASGGDTGPAVEGRHLRGDRLPAVAAARNEAAGRRNNELPSQAEAAGG
jgi:short-subunit dehydrogenase